MNNNNNNYLGDSEYEALTNIRKSVKSNRFENDINFVNAFTKYDINVGSFLKPVTLKYVDQYGGIPVGTSDGKVLVDSSDSHTMVIGATGSKKSRLVVMPSVHILADAGESMVISDPKAEIYERTAGYLKKKGYQIYVVNLRSPSYGNSWNPLYIPYLYYSNGQYDRAYEFANDISINLMLDEMTLSDPFWDYSSRDLFFGLELLLFKYCYENSLDTNYSNIGNLLRLRTYLFKNYYSSGTSVINNSDSRLNQYMNEDFITMSALLGTVNAPEKTQASILSTFDEKMRPFTIQPDLLNMLSGNNIDMTKLGEEKTAVYVIMPDEKTTYHKLVSLFIKQSYEHMIYNAQEHNDGKMRIRVNFLLDEFSSLPAIKDFPSMISAGRSRNIRFTLVIQSKNQLLQKYGEQTETILSNCSNWVFLTSRELALLQEISLLCGKNAQGTKYLVPPEALQHLSKEKGEALVLSGRLFPYITRLFDIKSYDNDNVLSPPELHRIENYDNALASFLSQKSTKTDSNQKRKRKEKYSVQEHNRDDEMTDIQRELEAKFDELFGPIEDD